MGLTIQYIEWVESKKKVYIFKLYSHVDINVYTNVIKIKQTMKQYKNIYFCIKIKKTFF